MNINHISVSRADTYKQCPYKYRYRYHLNVIPDTTPFYFTFGKIVHKVIEEYTKSQGNESLNELTKQVLSGNIELEPGKVAPSLQYKDLTRLNLHLENFLKLTDKIGTTGDVEFPFDIDLDPPNNRKWVGFIDRLIRTNNKFFIVDYKTTKPGKFRKDKESIKYDLQIQGYCWIVRKLFNVDAKDIRAALYYLEDAQLIDAGTFTNEILDAIPSKMLSIYKTIENHDPNQVIGITGDHCRLCDYKDICCFYKQYSTGISIGNPR